MLSSIVYIDVDHCSAGDVPTATTPSLKFLHLLRVCKPFRFNTCKSLSKQTTLTLIGINTYEKQGRGGNQLINSIRIGNSGRNPRGWCQLCSA